MHQAVRRESARCWLDRQLQIDSWESPGLSPTNWVILFLIILSVVIFTMETDEALAQSYSHLFYIINLAILLLFLLEFVLRVWSAGEARGIRGLGPRTRYAGRGWLTIDFLAFGPELIVLCLLALGVPVGFSPEGLKAIRLARLLKLAKFFPAAKMVVDVVNSVRHQLFVSAAAAAGLIYLSSVLIYYTEGANNPEEFGSVTKALWWSVITLTTVGYGDVFPETTLGRIAAGLIALIGVGLIALPGGILAGAFMEKLAANRDAAKESSAKDS